MFVIGVDPSLASTGICFLNRWMELVDYRILSFPASDPFRLDAYYQDMTKCLAEEEGAIKLIGIESPVAFGKYSSTMGVSIGKIHGVFESVFQHFTVDYIEPLPNQIKKFITGSGKAEKEEVKKSLEKKWGFDEIEWDNKLQLYDLYDALGIAVFTHCFCYKRKQRKLTKIQREIIQSVKKRYDKKRAKFRY